MEWVSGVQDGLRAENWGCSKEGSAEKGNEEFFEMAG